jgi:FAD/FMN-containing dehydrogenase
MSISEDPTLTALESFLSQHPAIKYATPTSPNYASLRATYNLDNISSPLAIVRPQNAEDVAAIVKYATSQGINFVVRSGGGNLFGKSQVQGAITIDMRDINFVEVEQHKTSAKVGGGVLMGDLGTALDKEGLATAVGTIPFVGFIGWAVYGGKNDIPWSSSSSPKHTFSMLRTYFKPHSATLSKS